MAAQTNQDLILHRDTQNSQYVWGALWPRVAPQTTNRKYTEISIGLTKWSVCLFFKLAFYVTDSSISVPIVSFQRQQATADNKTRGARRKEGVENL